MILLNQDQSRIIDYIKTQIQIFLAEIDDFYPFGAEIKIDGTLTPVAASLDENDLSVNALISSLEQNVANGLLDKTISLAAVAIAVNIPEDNQQVDGVQVRFYQPHEEPEYLSLKYRKVGGVIEFL